MEGPGQVKPEPVSDTGLEHENVWSGTKVTQTTLGQQEEDPYDSVKHELLDPGPHTQESHEVSSRDAVSSVFQSECWQGCTNGVVAGSQLAEVPQSNSFARVLEKKRRVRSAVPFLPDPLKVCAEEQREVQLPSSSEDEAEEDDAVEIVGSVQMSHGPPYILPNDAVDTEGNTSLQTPAKIFPTVVNTKHLLLGSAAQNEIQFPVPLPRIAPRPSPWLQNGLSENMKHSTGRTKCEKPLEILPDALHKTSRLAKEPEQCLLEDRPSAHDSWTGTGCRRGLRVDANGFPVKKNGTMYKTKGYIYEKARAYYERRMATETMEEKALRLEKARQRYYRKKEEKGSPLHTLHESTGKRRSRQHRAHSARTCSKRDPQGSRDPPTAQLLQTLIASSALQAGQRPLLPCPSSLDCGEGVGATYPPAELMARLQRLRAALLMQAGHPRPPTDEGSELGASVNPEAE